MAPDTAQSADELPVQFERRRASGARAAEGINCPRWTVGVIGAGEEVVREFVQARRREDDEAGSAGRLGLGAALERHRRRVTEFAQQLPSWSWLPARQRTARPADFFAKESLRPRLALRLS